MKSLIRRFAQDTESPGRGQRLASEPPYRSLVAFRSVNQLVGAFGVKAFHCHHHVAGLLDENQAIAAGILLQAGFGGISLGRLQVVVAFGESSSINLRELGGRSLARPL